MACPLPMTQVGRSPSVPASVPSLSLEDWSKAVVPGLRRTDSRLPGPARCRCGAVVMSWLISAAVRASLQTRTSSIWPTKPYQPPGVAGQESVYPVPIWFEAAGEVLGRSRDGPEELAVEVEGHRPGRAVDDECDAVPQAVVDRAGRRDLVDRAGCRVVRPAVEPAVGADIELRDASVGGRCPWGRRLVAEDDAAAGGPEPGFEGLACLGAVDQAVG